MIGSRFAPVLLAAITAQGGTGGVEGGLLAPGAATAGAVVWLSPVEDGTPAAPLDSVVVDQYGLRFVPAVLAVTPGTRVTFRNSDPVLHNVFSPPRIGAGFDLGTYARTDLRSHVFTEPGAWLVLCHVHPEMALHVVVVPSRWTAIADAGGRFRVAGVPAGRYVLHVWHRHFRDPAPTLVVTDGGVARVTLTLARAHRPRAGAFERAGP